VFLLALPAGALANIVDRRKMLLIVQFVLGIFAGTLGFVVYLGAASPLLLLCFAMGVGAANTARAWQAIVPNVRKSAPSTRPKLAGGGTTLICLRAGNRPLAKKSGASIWFAIGCVTS
jgi:MFS family permease